MAFALDAKNNGIASGLALTVAAGAKLVVATFSKRMVTDPTGVTFGGVAMTRRTEYVNGTALGAEIWYLINPPTGAKTLDFTLSGSFRVTVSSYTVGAGKAPAYDTENGGFGTAVTASDVVTPTTTASLIVSCAVHESSTACTSEGTGQTGLMATTAFAVDEGIWNTAASYEISSSTSADTQSYTNASSDTWAIASAVFKEVTAPQTVPVSGRTSASTYGSVSFTTGNTNKAVAGRTSASSYGAVTPVAGPVSVTVAGRTSVSSYGTVTASAGGGGQSVAVGGRTSSSTYGTNTPVAGPVSVSVSGRTSASTYGAISAVPGGILASPNGWLSASLYGTVTASTPGGGQTATIAGRISISSYGTTQGGNTVANVTDYASIAAAVTAGYSSVAEDRGATAPAATRYRRYLHKGVVGGIYADGMKVAALGEGSSQANADTVALNSVNAQRKHIFGGSPGRASGSAQSIDSRGGTHIVD